MIHSIFYRIRSNQVLLFGSRLLAVLAIIAVLDFVIGKTLRYYYFKQDSGLQYRTTYSMDSTRADFLVFGSSRANHHYYPEVFEKDLNMSYYNLGRDGSYILYHYAVLKSVLKRYTPKIIVLDFMSREFADEPGSYDRLSALLPYYKTHPEVRPIVDLRGKWERLKMISQIYPFNSSLLTIAIGNTAFNKTRDTDARGYVALNHTWQLALQSDHRPRDYALDSVKIRIYQKFIEDCKTAGTDLYVICSPYFIKEETTDASVSVARQIATVAGIPFIDFENNSAFFNNKLFADAEHLNNAGAIFFSQMAADSIKTMLAQKQVISKTIDSHVLQSEQNLTTRSHE